MRVWLGIALLWLVGCGNPDKANYWIKRLEDPAQELEAVRNLRRIGDPAAVPALSKLFARKRHPDILRAIASFRDKPGFDKSAVAPTLIEALQFTEDEYNNATLAAEMAADLQATEVVDALVGVLDKPLPVKSRANLAKQAAIQALGRLKDKRAVDGLIRTMERPPEEQDFLLAKKSAEALGEIGDPRAAAPLVLGLFRASTAHAPMFVEARVALVRLGEPAVKALIEAHQGKNEALNAMAKKLEFQPGIVQHKTALVLGDMRAPEAIDALRATLRGKMEGDSHRGVIYALGMIGTPATLPDLVTALEKHPDWHMRQSAAEALNLHPSRDALPALLTSAKSNFVTQDGEKFDNVRLVSAMAFARSAAGDGYAQLKPIVDSIPKEERDEVWDECLVRLEVSRDCKDDAACYAKKLDDAVLAKQESAAFHLAKLPGGAGKPQLPALIKKLQTKEPIVRLAVLYAFDQLADKSCGECIKALEAQIAADKGKTVKAQGADFANEMRVTLARISR